MVKGTSSPRLFAMAIAIAVFPVPGCPPISTALPAIFPSLMSSRMMPAALLASVYMRLHLPVRPFPELFDEDQVTN